MYYWQFMSFFFSTTELSTHFNHDFLVFIVSKEFTRVWRIIQAYIWVNNWNFMPIFKLKVHRKYRCNKQNEFACYWYYDQSWNRRIHTSTKIMNTFWLLLSFIPNFQSVTQSDSFVVVWGSGGPWRHLAKWRRSGCSSSGESSK